MKHINEKIVSYSIKKEEATPISNVEIMGENVKRPEVITGRTYKIKLPSEEYATYVTINDIVLNSGTENQEIRPFEIFINSKNATHRQWVDTLTRVISAVFRKGGEIDFLVEELKSITDPSGGGWYKGRYIKSLVSEIGSVLGEHIYYLNTINSIIPAAKEPINQDVGEISGATRCKACGANAVIVKDGCPTCLACGDSKCG